MRGLSYKLKRDRQSALQDFKHAASLGYDDAKQELDNEHEAQEQGAREKAEQLEHGREARRQAAQAEAERQAQLAAEQAEAKRQKRERQEHEARATADQLEAARQATLDAQSRGSQARRERLERTARLERMLAHLRDPMWQGIGAIVAIAALAVALGAWLWTDIHAALFPSPTPTLGIGSTRISEKDGMVMVYVPASEFLMGSTDSDSQAASDEKPQHKVYLDAFWIDQTEVTNAQYKQCVQAQECKASLYADDSRFNGDNQPVVGVDWNDAKAYCEWAGRQLPAEAQWEKAAQGTDGRIYPWGNQIATCEYAVMNDGGDGCGKGNAAWAVGSKPKGNSPYGAFDMAGNVWEWVSDWYDEKYYGSSPPKNPTGPTSGQNCVLRGGSWDGGAQHVRAALRLEIAPELRDPYVAFRCSR